jgi:alpha-L-fucosidase 2
MNYWSAFVGNLIDDVSEPLFSQISATHSTGLNTAKTMYNCPGSVAHHNTDLWGDSAPQDNWPSSTFWSQGLAWLVTHTYDYYLFTQDKNWLSSNITPLRDSVLFYTKFLTPYNNWMVTNPSLSPENTFVNPEGGSASITCGPTIDNSILWTLFGAISELENALGTAGSDSSFLSTVANLRTKLPPLRKNQYGGLMEWINDYAEV